MSNHRFALAVLAVILGTGSGCYRIRYVNQSPAEALPAWEGWHHSLVEGLWDFTGPINVSRICPRGFAVVESQTSIPNMLAASPTYGFWNPQTVKVTCRVYPTPPLAPTQSNPES